jgi:hypothetical protein
MTKSAPNAVVSLPVVSELPWWLLVVLVNLEVALAPARRRFSLACMIQQRQTVIISGFAVYGDVSINDTISKENLRVHASQTGRPAIFDTVVAAIDANRRANQSIMARRI